MKIVRKKPIILSLQIVSKKRRIGRFISHRASPLTRSLCEKTPDFEWCNQKKFGKLMFFQLLERALIKGITLITCFFYQSVQKKR